MRLIWDPSRLCVSVFPIFVFCDVFRTRRGSAAHLYEYSISERTQRVLVGRNEKNKNIIFTYYIFITTH